jgi:hypothetical protein
MGAKERARSVRREGTACGLGRRGGRQSPAAGDAPALPLGCSTPDTVIDVIGHGVLEAGRLDRTLGTDPPRDLDSYAVAREEQIGRVILAPASCHPRSVHRPNCYSLANGSHAFLASDLLRVSRDLSTAGHLGPDTLPPDDHDPRPGSRTTPRAATRSCAHGLPRSRCTSLGSRVGVR